jgi:hypothetical protein
VAHHGQGGPGLDLQVEPADHRPVGARVGEVDALEPHGLLGGGCGELGGDGAFVGDQLRFEGEGLRHGQ